MRLWPAPLSQPTMCPACLRAAGGVRAERWKFFTLAIACHEGHPPADAIFAYPGCPQPVPARSPCPGPRPAEKARTAASPGRAARRRGRGGDCRLEVVRGDRAVGSRCGPELLAVLGAARGAADESTFRR